MKSFSGVIRMHTYYSHKVEKMKILQDCGKICDFDQLGFDIVLWYIHSKKSTRSINGGNRWVRFPKFPTVFP